MENFNNICRKYFRCILLVPGTVAVGLFAGSIAWDTGLFMLQVFLAYLLEIALVISTGFGAEKIWKAFFYCFFFCLLSLTAFLLVLGMKIGFGSALEAKVIVIILLFAFTLLFCLLALITHYARKEAYEDRLKEKDEIPVVLADADDDD